MIKNCVLALMEQEETWKSPWAVIQNNGLASWIENNDLDQIWIKK